MNDSNEFELSKEELGSTKDVYFNEPIISISKDIKLPPLNLKVTRNLGNLTQRMVAPSILSPNDIRECRELKKVT